MHWTVLSDYEIFEDKGTVQQQGQHVEEVHVGPATLILSRQADGSATVVRLISPSASDYLRADWQPGALYQG